MARSVNVQLGGKTYEITALPISQAKAWRESLAVPFATISQALTTANVVEINQFGDMSKLVQQMSGVLLGSIDLMLDLMFQYSLSLSEDREWIEQNAFDEEALAAFAEVLKLAFPFGVLLEVVTGRMASKTFLNSPSTNGVLPLPASGPKRKEKTR
jgi:hypothetical protein